MLLAIAAYNFDIVYRSGLNNANADGLSRLPGLEYYKDDTRIGIESVRAICNCIHSQPFIQSLCLSADAVNDHLTEPDWQGMSDRDWRMAQQTDAVLRPWIEWVRANNKPGRQDYPHTPANSSLHRNYDSLVLQRGILHRKVMVDGCDKFQLVLPSAYVGDALNGLHNDIGHPGRDRTLSRLRDRFYWPGMSADVEDWIRNCGRCIRRKTPTNARAPLVSINSTQPLELVCMDFLTLETSKGGYQHMLIITDHFTRYAQAIPTQNMTAKTTAEAFYNHFVMHYGIPLRIHSDQGANFESRLLRELCQILSMEKSRTTSYHPMGNGMCERFNRTLLNILGTLNPEQKKDWKNHVAPLVHAYNCTKHESTGYSPFYLMFGREPRLPIDLAFGVNTNKQHHSLTSYAEGLRKRLQESYEIATETTKKSQGRQKGGYDLKVRGAVIEPGDRVLVKILAFDGKHKLADRWEDGVYIVLSQPNQDIPVFVVRRENGEGRERTLHRNHLLPVGFLPAANRPISDPVPKPRKRKVIVEPVVEDTTGKYEVESVNSDFSEINVLVAPNDSVVVSEQAAIEVVSDSQMSGDDRAPAEPESVSSGDDDHILQHSP